jgi:phenylacetate-CoA ligase
MLKQNDLNNLLEDYKNKSEMEIIAEAEQLVCGLTNETLKSVKAYREYIASIIGQAPNSCSTIEEFKTLPPTGKQEYLKNYSRSDLVNTERFADTSWNISATSGSTGEPFYFPRDHYQDLVYAASAQAYLVNFFNIDTKKTLYINAFPMGVWIGGVFTYIAINEVMRKGYKLSIINPGIIKAEVLKAIKNIGSEFDQILIGSYAPFLKDILDDGVSIGIDWQDLPVKFIFSAEAFSEEFRDYLAEKTGINPITDTLNHYGTVDLGTMSHETPFTTLIRRLAYNNKDLFKELFGDEARTPTLTQYDPRLFYFEEVEGRLFCTAKTGYPMIRYDLKDKGGVRLKSEVEALFEKHGINLLDEAEKNGISDTIWNLPLVFVYERADFSVSYYAFQVYPEIIRKSLLNRDIEPQVTGKFTAEVDYVDGRQQLNIYTEVRPEVEMNEKLKETIRNVIHNYLKVGSSEYAQTCVSVGDETIKPNIILKQYEDLEYFKPGAKQKWVKN